MADCKLEKKSFIGCPYVDKGQSCKKNIELKTLFTHFQKEHNKNCNIGNQFKLTETSYRTYILMKVCKQLYLIKYNLKKNDNLLEIEIIIIEDCCEKKKTCNLNIYNNDTGKVYKNIDLDVVQYSNLLPHNYKVLEILRKWDFIVLFDKCCIDENALIITLDKSVMECIVCYERLKFPITQCRNGHIVGNCCIDKLKNCPICSITFTQDQRGRNLFAENALDELAIVCKYENCAFIDKYSKTMNHEATCKYQNIRCPFACKYQYSPWKVMQHIREMHVENILSREENHTFVENSYTAKLDIFIIEKFDIPFVIFQATRSDEFYFMVNAIVLETSSKFCFQLIFASGSNSINFHTDCNKYKEPYNIDLDKVFTKDKYYIKLSLVTLKPFIDDIRLPYKISITKMDEDDEDTEDSSAASTSKKFKSV